MNNRKWAASFGLNSFAGATIHRTARPVSKRHGLGIAGAVLLMTAGCDFDVVNPGPAADGFLDRREAHEAMVNGAERLFDDAFGSISLLGAAVTRELFPAGTTGRFGIDRHAQRGHLPIDQTNSEWIAAQRARWVAENTIERFGNVLEGSEFSDSHLVARAYLWAGFANRLMGENFCEAVIDGGPIEPHTVFYQRAESHFTNAMDVAGRAGEAGVAMAARAARASVRASVGAWEGAVADAAGVPADFVFVLESFDGEEDQYNYIYWGNANTPYRKHTTWRTVYEEYYPETGDPRIRWGTNPDFPVGDAGVGTLGLVPWFFQEKFTELDAPVNLASGREMRLIEAEAQLVAGNWQQAMAIINGLRSSVVSDLTGEPLPGWEASNLEEAWTHLKRERAIELWLEARRLGDMRRWEDSGVPGELHPREMAVEENYLAADRDLCFPVPQAERDRNPNI